MFCKRYFLLIILSLTMVGLVPAQTTRKQSAQLERPKLVVGIVVDQMRWDYLYRYYNKYVEGGFKRLLNEGFSCENTMLNYIPSITGVGHASIFTGSVPSIHGIAGNSWVDPVSGKSVYCTDDSTVDAVGVASSPKGKMSPRNLMATTITDELRMATNFQSKVVGVSLKDRAAILPAGHNPTAAFWFDEASEQFITSNYYLQQLPEWVKLFNATKPVEKLIENGWNTLLPINQYTESTPDDSPWEGLLKGAEKPVFPYDLKKAFAQDRSSFEQTPFGNTLTLQFARAAVDGYQLGQGGTTDFLTINCASTDHAAHLYGPNSIELEDVYLRLDRDLTSFFIYLDTKVGKGNYLVFLTADHAGANSEGYLAAHKMPTGLLDEGIAGTLKKRVEKEFGSDKLIARVGTFQVSFNNHLVDSLQIDREKLKAFVVEFLKRQEGILYVADQDKLAVSSIPEPIKTMAINGYNPQRSGSVVFIPQAGWTPSSYTKGANHSLWNPYDTHIPLLFMGWKIKHGALNRRVNITDIAATVAALLHIQMPSGCVGLPVTEVTDGK
ncbi:alkaline phosphatase PafA [Paludibacter jiangxiensis]|uniref:Predicted pyrophosphatase or phosphodiesterase, AlkP superfamily n=1 Tax=Paludibacter jiangxiensis TaxID=681398 RepID=A0A171AN25_9BACT|nr:predicted pyrophosphatase or phosphodiesterase, AlkP superfamily [Paludibacter jiangxiensis]